LAPQKSRQNGLCQIEILFFFDRAPVSQYVVNEGANKLNSRDSVDRKCGDCVMSHSAHR